MRSGSLTTLQFNPVLYLAGPPDALGNPQQVNFDIKATFGSVGSPFTTFSSAGLVGEKGKDATHNLNEYLITGFAFGAFSANGDPGKYQNLRVDNIVFGGGSPSRTRARRRSTDGGGSGRDGLAAPPKAGVKD